MGGGGDLLPLEAKADAIVFEATDALGVTAKKTLRLKIAPAPKKKSRR